MTPLQRDSLAVKFVKTWPNGPDQGIWVDVFDEQDIDYPQAEQAYNRMRASEERPPSAARFLSIYRTLNPPTAWSSAYAGPAVSFDQHISNLTRRADAGDHDAIAELDIWADNEAKGLTVKSMGWQR